MRHGARTLARGFTLIEVIVSVALFALLMTIVYSGFSTAVRAYDAAEQRVGKVESMRVVSAFLRRSLTGAHALALAKDRKWTLQFAGTSDRLRYIADLPGYVGVGGLHELVLELEGDADRQDLVLRRRALTFDQFGELEGELETRVLADDIKSFVLRFYGHDEDREDPAWTIDWSSDKRMPLLVELSITPKQGPPWPVIQVRPVVDSIRYVNAGKNEVNEPPAEDEDDDEIGFRDPNSDLNSDPGAEPNPDVDDELDNVRQIGAPELPNNQRDNR